MNEENQEIPAPRIVELPKPVLGHTHALVVELSNGTAHVQLGNGQTFRAEVNTAACADDAADTALAESVVGLTTPMPLPVPELITRPQFFVAARRVLGLSEDDLTALIDLLPAGEHRETARDFLRNSQTFRRAHPALVGLAALKGLTPAQLDDFFRYASSIE